MYEYNGATSRLYCFIRAVKPSVALTIHFAPTDTSPLGVLAVIRCGVILVTRVDPKN